MKNLNNKQINDLWIGKYVKIREEDKTTTIIFDKEELSLLIVEWDFHKSKVFGLAITNDCRKLNEDMFIKKVKELLKDW